MSQLQKTEGDIISLVNLKTGKSTIWKTVMKITKI